MQTLETNSELDALCLEVVSRRDKEYAARSKTTPQHVPRASNIGECDRELLYQLTHWQQRPPIDAWLGQRFQRGHDVERIVTRELADIGIEVLESQLSCEIRDRDNVLLATAHIDGRIRHNGLVPVFDCKSLNPNIWGGINCAADFRERIWMRKYPRQLLLYMYATGEPNGLFLIDDCLGHWKLLPMRLEDHLDECEQILKRLRRVVDAKAKNNLAAIPFIDNPVICKACWAHQAGLCMPPMDFSKGGIHVIDDAELQEMMRLAGDTEKTGEAYVAAVDNIKAHFKARGPGSYIVGDFAVTTKQQKNGTRTTWEKLGTEPA